MDPMDSMSPELAEQIFNQCDIRNKGALTLEDLSQLTGFTDQDTAFIFGQMDVNKAGIVTKEEFIARFATALNMGESQGFSNIRRRSLGVVLTPLSRTFSASPSESSIDEEPIAKISPDLDIDSGRLDILPCQEEVLALYDRLHALGGTDRLRSGSIPDLLNQFVKIIDGVSKELIEQRGQNDRLQALYKREKIRHNQQIDEVESNLTATITEAKEKVRREERDKLEREKEHICQQFELELTELKSTISTLQKSVLNEDNTKQQKSEELRQKVQDLSKDNMRLRHNLVEKQNELVRIQAAMAKLRQNFDDKLTDWSTEKEQLVHISENMEHQLQLLYEANTQLHDTNDNLRSALETRQAHSRQINIRTPSPLGSGSGGRMSPIVQSRMTPGQYDNPNDHARPNTLSVRRDATWLRRLEDSMETDEDIDSGLMTRGSNTTSESASAGEEYSQRRMVIYGQNWNGHMDRDGMTSRPVLPTVPLDYSLVRTDSLSSSGTGTRSSHTYDSRMNERVFQPTEPTGPPERTFRVVIVGDASVGKTSLIRRLIKEQFHENSPATIGIECHGVKVLRIDGRNVALQLWDTAGQEKFRSLCKAYFRRADGAILTYDCTCEQSFLNVRYWLDAVQESVTRKIPVLMCANKVDLRISAAAQGLRCVSRDDGENLAKTNNTLFLETSAKDGINVSEAAVHLAREMLAAEDFEVHSACIMLEQQKKKSNCTSCSKG